jgi:hypothetical protein
MSTKQLEPCVDVEDIGRRAKAPVSARTPEERECDLAAAVDSLAAGPDHRRSVGKLFRRRVIEVGIPETTISALSRYRSERMLAHSSAAVL